MEFLALRMTLKFTILAAILKPVNRAIAPISELNLVNPRESISPSVLGYKPSVQVRPTLRFRAKSIQFSGIGKTLLIPVCFKSFRRSVPYIYA